MLAVTPADGGLWVIVAVFLAFVLREYFRFSGCIRNYFCLLLHFIRQVNARALL